MAFSLTAILGWGQERFKVNLDNIALETWCLPNVQGATQGYLTRLVNLTNNDSQPHLVSLRLVKEFDRYPGNIGEISKTVMLAPHEKATIKLRAWCRLNIPRVLRVVVDGAVQDDQIMTDTVSYYSYSSGLVKTGLLLSHDAGKHQEVFKEIVEKAVDQLGLSSSGYGRNWDYYFSISANPIEHWGDDWLDYTVFNIVVLSGREWSSLNEEKRDCLWRFLETGGILILMDGEAQVPQPWRARKRTTANETSYYVGFGRLVLMGPSISGSDPEFFFEILKDARQGGTEGQKRAELTNLNQGFSIVGKLTVPLRGFFLLMLAFVVLLGPVNMLVLGRKNRKIWLLATIPLISLGGTLAVLIYAIATEGLRPTIRREGLTILDESARKAITIGSGGVYAPLTLGERLRFDPDTELRLYIPYSQRDWATVDWTEGQSLTGGWVVSRLPFRYQTRCVETRRERLTVSGTETEGFQIVNGFGVPIESLLLADGQGAVYRAEQVAPGQKVGVQRLPQVPEGDDAADSLRILFESDWTLPHPAVTPDNPFNLRLPPNTYLAVLQGAPFMDAPLAANAHQKARSLVYGIRGTEP